MGSPGRLKTRLGAPAVCLALTALLFAAPAHADQVICSEGEGPGQCTEPRGVAVDREAGILYVADAGNREVDVFEAEGGAFLGSFGEGELGVLNGVAVDEDTGSAAHHDLYAIDRARVVRLDSGGDFLLAFGGDTVASGPGDSSVDETQQVTVKATGGTFRLRLTDPFALGDAETAETVPLPFNASAAEVKAALDGLATIGGLGGSVSVSGGPGNATGSSPYLVTFEGDLGGDDIPTLDAVFKDELTPPSSASVSVSTPTPGGAYEVCEPEAGDTCKLGSAGADPGFFASQPKLDVGPGGVVYVADNVGGGCRLQQLDHEGSLVKTIELGACSSLRGLAVDSGGDFYAAFGGGAGIHGYEADGDPLESFHPSFNIQDIALDGEDNLFVADSSGSGGTTATYLYDAAHTLLKALYGNGTQLGRAISLAPLSTAQGDLFLAEQASSPGLGRVVQIALPSPGPAVHPDLELNRADPVSATKATLISQVNPEGKASEFGFQYVTEAAYLKDIEEGGDGFSEAEESASTEVPAPESPPPFLEGSPLFAPAPVEARIGCDPPRDPPQAECLKPQTAYRFRAVASNADGEAFGPVGGFETEPPLRIEAVFSDRVGADAARLAARATAFGIPLTGRFQYVTETLCLADVKAAQAEGAEGPAAAEHCFDRASRTPEIEFGDQEGPVTRTAQLRSLKQGTAYRYRVVLGNLYVPEETGETLSFATYSLPGQGRCPNDALRTGPAAKLPDCRAYEMVSPADKEGGEIRVLLGEQAPAELNKAAAAVPAAGRGLTYSSVRAFGDAASSPYTSQYLASRSAQGWQSHGISPPREGASFSKRFDTDFTLFSEDLRFGWLRPESEPPLTEDAIPGYTNLYRRDNSSNSYAAICPVKPPTQDPNEFRPLPVGASADGARAVYRASDKLSDGAADIGSQLYACEIGAAAPVVASVLPPARGGEAYEGISVAGTQTGGGGHRSFSLHNAVSADAERIYWTDSPSGPGRIYLRERPFAEGEECAGPEAPCTVAVSEAVGGEEPEAGAVFWTAARDGSAAIFGFTAGPQEGELYEYDAETGSASLIAGGVSGLSDCDTASQLATRCGGVAGWSEDAEVLYLVSTEKETEDAEAGTDNLYRYEAGAPAGERFDLVASLPGGTRVLRTGVSNCAADNLNPVARCSRATPGGEALAFLSTDPLTGYDNAELGSGEPAPQVFLYDAGANGGAGELLCVSCNPGGARPRGPSGIPRWESAFQASRALSADGRRLFFESADALLPADTNDVLDIYQWERAGKGACEASDPNYFPRNGGCIDLISSGEGREDSHFIDASADGRDVFFKTTESLWGPDPGLIDIYDARAGGGFPEPAPPRPPCEGEACQSPPAPPSLPPGATALHRGPGNLAGQKPRCGRAARTARRHSRRAKRMRRASRRAKAPARRRALRRRAKGAAKRARRDSRRAKRCRRARARAARRARR